MVGTDGVVKLYPSQESLAQGGVLEIAIIDFIELLSVGTVGPFHMAVELGGMGWQDEKVYAQVLAGPLEGSLIFATAVHLDRLQGER